jgi:tRNA 2-selenouridine synthase
VTSIPPAALYPSGAKAPAFELIDVRAPVEYAQGAMPRSVNLPILTDEERHLVGIRYKEAGQDAAIALGYTLVTPHLPTRIEAWRAVCQTREAAVTCWRGGLRSKLACEFIAAPGVPRVEGGYKALRAYLMEALEPCLARTSVVVIAGFTGSGKTTLLHALEQANSQGLVLDLEREARHRGSAFGKTGVTQPSQASFENSIAAQMVLHNPSTIVVEDESRNIGALQLPTPLVEAMRQGVVVLVDEPVERRAKTIFRDYVLDLTRVLGPAETAVTFRGALSRIRKRLDGEVVNLCLGALDEAETSGSWLEPAAHLPWIRALLENYYDPRYRKGLAQQARPVVFRGSREECLSWLVTTLNR